MVQAVLIFWSEIWFLSVVISKNLEGAHVRFLRQVTGKTVKQQGGGNWRSVVAESVLKEAVTQKLMTYIDKRKVTVEEWVSLRPILQASI